MEFDQDSGTGTVSLFFPFFSFFLFFFLSLFAFLTPCSTYGPTSYYYSSTFVVFKLWGFCLFHVPKMLAYLGGVSWVIKWIFIYVTRDIVTCNCHHLFLVWAELS